MERWRKVWIEQDPRTANWFLRWRERGEDGKIHRRSRLCASHSDAVAKKDRKEKELMAAGSGLVAGDTPIAPYLEHYMDVVEKIRLLRPSSIELKRRALEPFIVFVPTVGRMTRDNIILYRDGLFKKLKSATVGIRMREVKAFVRWLHFEKILPENVFQRIEMPRQELLPHFLTDEQINALEANATGSLLAVVRMAYMTGMRVGEILAAEWKDIEWVNEFDPKKKKMVLRGHLTVSAHTAKTRRSRTIALRREVVALIGTKGSGRIFKEFGRSGLRHAWVRLRKKAKIEGRARFHDLRHTFCKMYLQGGGTIADLMSITGHQSIVMMRVYAHFENRYKTKRIDAIQFPEDKKAQGE